MTVMEKGTAQRPAYIDGKTKLMLIERRLPEGWAGRSLDDLEEDGRLKLVAVIRAGTPRLDVRELVGQEGDVLHLAVTADALDLVTERFSSGVPAGTAPEHPK